MEDSDAAAIGRARAGDPDSFRVLVERYSRALFHLAFRVTGNEEDAEDAVQETFLRAYRRLGSYDARAGFNTWLYRIAVNCSLDLLRSRRRRREAAPDPRQGELQSQAAAAGPSPERLAFSREVRGRVDAALAGLSPTERAAFLMRHCDGIGIEEIARVLGRPNGATRHSVFRAVQKLRRALEPLAGGKL